MIIAFLRYIRVMGRVVRESHVPFGNMLNNRIIERSKRIIERPYMSQVQYTGTSQGFSDREIFFSFLHDSLSLSPFFDIQGSACHPRFICTRFSNYRLLFPHIPPWLNSIPLRLPSRWSLTAITPMSSCPSLPLYRRISPRIAAELNRVRLPAARHRPLQLVFIALFCLRRRRNHCRYIRFPRPLSLQRSR